MHDRQLIYAAAFLRAVATGMTGVLLGIYLAKLGWDAARIGYVVSAGLAGCAASSLAATLWGNRHGQRRMLIELTLLATAGLAVLATGSEFLLLLTASFVGMVNGMGRDRGAALVLEQAMLPAMVDGARRTRAFATYNLVQDIGHALGALLAGASEVLQTWTPADDLVAQRWVLLLGSGLVLLSAVAYLRLRNIPHHASPLRTQNISQTTVKTVSKISALFALDSLGGGFLTTALLSFFFYERFGVSEDVIGVLFFLARLLNAVAHLAAAWLAERIGLVNTMVFTHLPSSLLLASVAIAPNFPIAAILFLLREGLVEMDVPTRQSYVMAVVAPSERTFASGVTHLVRLAAWAVAPALAGPLMEEVGLAVPLLIGAALKIVYDVLLYLAFRNVRPPEEVAAPTSNRA